MTTSYQRCELVLELQKKLRYKFSNILLLHEALTHSFDDIGPFWTIENSGVFYRKKNNKKLKLLGKSVLKFTVAYLSLLNNQEGANEGQLTKYLESTLETSVLTKIGEALSLGKYIQVAGGLHRDPNFSMDSLFSPVIQAIFGAIFIDVGGSTSDDCFREVLVFFVLLWLYSDCPVITDYLRKRRVIVDLEDLDKCFPPPPFPDIVKLTLRKYNPRLELPELDTLQMELKYPFQRDHLLEQALTHDSVHQYKELRNVPDYERLECIGDAVYELVICEYLFWHFFNDSKDESSTSTFCKVALDKYTGQEFQKELASHLSLLSFVRKPSHVKLKIDSFSHDFVESVIGAVYVDSQFKYGIRQVKNVLVSLCQRIRIPTWLKHDSLVLPYTVNTFYGSKCRLQKYFQRDSSSMNCKRPAVVVVQVIIRDIHTFQTAWRYFCSSQEEHEERINNAVDFERKHGMDQITDSQATCNEMEFNRGSLYTLAACQTPKFRNENDLPSSYIPESRFSSTFRGQNNTNNISFENYQTPQQSWMQWIRGHEMNYFWCWKGVGEVVGMLTLATCVCLLVSSSSYINALICAISLFHLFSDDQFVFGNIVWDSIYTAVPGLRPFGTCQAPRGRWMQWARGLEMDYFWYWKGLGEILGMLVFANNLYVLISPSSYLTSALIYVIPFVHLFSDNQFVFGNVLWDCVSSSPRST